MPSIIRPLYKRAEQAIFLEERVMYRLEEFAFDEVEQASAERALVAPAWVGGSDVGGAD